MVFGGFPFAVGVAGCVEIRRDLCRLVFRGLLRMVRVVGLTALRFAPIF